MKRGVSILVAFGFLGVAVQNDAFGQKANNANKNGNGDILKATDQHYAMLMRYTQLEGEVQAVNASKVTIRVKYDHPVKNENANNNNNNNNKNRNRKLSPQQRAIQQQMAQMRNFHMEKDFLDFELPLVEKVVVRKLNLGVQYDDKGNPVMKKTDPKSNLPGVAGELPDVTAGAEVTVLLAAPKAGTSRPQVRVIIVEEDVPSLTQKKNKK